MYSSGYSQVAKHSPQAQKRMQYHTKNKSCGYYMRIVFFFSSLIQSLIIVSLVLFLVYGKKYDSVDTARIQDLEESFSRLSIENVELRLQRKNLTTLLNKTLTEKARNDWDLVAMRSLANTSVVVIQNCLSREQQCNSELFSCRMASRVSAPPHMPRVISFNPTPGCDHLNAKYDLLNTNFTQTVRKMSMEMEQVNREKDSLTLEAIRLRRDKAMYEKTIELFQGKCKDDFVQSLMGISNVTKAFLEKIESLFPSHMPFHLTCEKQRDFLEQIRTNCTNLSRDVEDKFQRYLNDVGDRVSSIQSENARLKAENWRLSSDYRWCSQNRTGMIQQHKQDLTKLQLEHDKAMEKIMVEKLGLLGEIDVLKQSVVVKTKEVDHLNNQLRQLNMSCMPRIPSQPCLGLNCGMTPGGTGGLTRTGLDLNFGSPRSPFSQPGSTGTGSLGSSAFPSGSGSSTGSLFNKPLSTGTGSLGSSAFPSGSGSSTGSLFNKPQSTGTGSLGSSAYPSGSGSSTGSENSKPLSTGTGSLGFGSTGQNPSGTGSNKPPVTGRGSSPFGSSAGSTGSVHNPGSSGTSLGKLPSSGSSGSTSRSGPSSPFSWFGGSNSGSSRSGGGTGKPSSGTGFGGSSGGGRSVNAVDHVKDLLRVASSTGPLEREELARILG